MSNGKRMRRSIELCTTTVSLILLSLARTDTTRIAEFDLMLARASLLLDITCYTALAFTTTAMHFLIFSTLQALASGANPWVTTMCELRLAC